MTGRSPYDWGWTMSPSMAVTTEESEEGMEQPK
jgi:hypothetical protein